MFEKSGLTVEDVTGYDALSDEQKFLFIETRSLPAGIMQALLMEKRLGNVTTLRQKQNAKALGVVDKFAHPQTD